MKNRIMVSFLFLFGISTSAHANCNDGVLDRDVQYVSTSQADKNQMFKWEAFPADAPLILRADFAYWIYKKSWKKIYIVDIGNPDSAIFADTGYNDPDLQARRNALHTQLIGGFLKSQKIDVPIEQMRRGSTAQISGQALIASTEEKAKRARAMIDARAAQAMREVIQSLHCKQLYVDTAQVDDKSLAELIQPAKSKKDKNDLLFVNFEK